MTALGHISTSCLRKVNVKGADWRSMDRGRCGYVVFMILSHIREGEEGRRICQTRLRSMYEFVRIQAGAAGIMWFMLVAVDSREMLEMWIGRLPYSSHKSHQHRIYQRIFAPLPFAKEEPSFHNFLKSVFGFLACLPRQKNWTISYTRECGEPVCWRCVYVCNISRDAGIIDTLITGTCL